MKAILCALVLVASLFAQQQNSSAATLCVNGNCTGSYSAPLPCSQFTVTIQVYSTFQNATFEIWASGGGLHSSTTVCSPFTTELDVPNVFLLHTGTINAFCLCATYNLPACMVGESYDLSVQAVVYHSGGCGFTVSQATHITTP